jgi:hypothetical protein
MVMKFQNGSTIRFQGSTEPYVGMTCEHFCQRILPGGAVECAECGQPLMPDGSIRVEHYKPIGIQFKKPK